MYFDKLIKEAKLLEARTDGIYVYGAGFYGKDVCDILQRNNIEVKGFIVTKIKNDSIVLGLPVREAKEVVNHNYGIILGVNDTYLPEVRSYLLENNMNMNNVLDGGKYLFEVNGREIMRENPIIEVTTCIGCRINCKFCPQTLLLRKYFEKNSHRKTIMTVSDFQKYLLNSPYNCDFVFAGMSEPFLNKDCTKLLKLACDAGRRVSLYTTLVGATKKDIDEILQLPLQLVVLHVADKYGYAQIPLSEEYYELIEYLLEAKKINGSAFVDSVCAQAEPDKKIEELCRGKYEILTSLHDRAGNLEGENLSGRKEKITNQKIYCSSFGKKLNSQVLLPDGTLVLCSSDYGLQHQLGNLLLDDYEKIRNGEEMKRVFRGMEGDINIDILCRNCCSARVVEDISGGVE